MDELGNQELRDGNMATDGTRKEHGLRRGTKMGIDCGLQLGMRNEEEAVNPTFIFFRQIAYRGLGSARELW